jgi:ribosomal protein S18 acetylase RimI-like enzyme
LLIFGQPPGEHDFDRWRELFGREFAHRPEVRHMTFQWDTCHQEGAIEPFLAAGFELDSNLTLRAMEVNPPPKVNVDVEVRRIVGDEEWEAALENQLLRREERWEPRGYATFMQRKMVAFRRLVDAGRGDWYGAFLGKELVADLGLFRDGEIARFQNVGTHPDYRRRGICGTLVYRVSKAALESQGAQELVMVADEHYHAARIYESVGFRPFERSAALYRAPAEAGAT